VKVRAGEEDMRRDGGVALGVVEAAVGVLTGRLFDGEEEDGGGEHVFLALRCSNVSTRAVLADGPGCPVRIY
jgi:hypothetical protein